MQSRHARIKFLFQRRRQATEAVQGLSTSSGENTLAERRDSAEAQNKSCETQAKARIGSALAKKATGRKPERLSRSDVAAVNRYYHAKKIAKRMTHEKLSKDVAQFLDSGRKIEQLPGARAERPRRAHYHGAL